MKGAVIVLACAACSPRTSSTASAVTVPVTLTVYADDGTDTPVANAIVLSHDANAQPYARTSSAADGTAAIDVPAQGSVTVIRPRNDAPGLNASSVFAIGAPIHLDFGWKPATKRTLLGSMRVNVPPFANATDVMVYNGCEMRPAARGYAFVHFYADCARATYDLVAIASGADAAPIASAELDAQTFVDGGVVTIPASFAAPQAFTATASNITRSDDLRFTRTERRAGLRYSTPVGALIASGASSSTMTVPTVAAGTEMEIRFESAYVSAPTLVRDIVPTATSYTASTVDPLPSPGISSSDDIHIEWGSSVPGPIPADGVYLYLQVNGGPYVNHWLLIAPAGMQGILYPVMPSDVYMPMSTMRAAIGLYDSDRFSDFPSFAQEADREVQLRFSDQEPSLHLRHSGQVLPNWQH